MPRPALTLAVAPARGSPRGNDVHRLWSHKIDLTAHAMVAAQARAFVTRHLLDHGIAHLIDDIQLVVSELATNATLHAQTPCSVILAATENAVYLEVHDGSYIGPRVVAARPLETSGRGIAIVQAVSQRWGVTQGTSGGKTVWAEFDI